jgi:hypothetical protein
LYRKIVVKSMSKGYQQCKGQRVQIWQSLSQACGLHRRKCELVQLSANLLRCTALVYMLGFSTVRVLLTPRGTCAPPEMYLWGRPRLRKLEASRPPKTAVQTTAHIVWLEKSPLLLYATVYWAEHARLASTHVDRDLVLSRPFLQK